MFAQGRGHSSAAVYLAPVGRDSRIDSSLASGRGPTTRSTLLASWPSFRLLIGPCYQVGASDRPTQRQTVRPVRLTERLAFGMVRGGEMTEWPKVPDSKSGVPVRVPWVRLPLSPPR